MEGGRGGKTRTTTAMWRMWDDAGNRERDLALLLLGRAPGERAAGAQRGERVLGVRRAGRDRADHLGAGRAETAAAQDRCPGPLQGPSAPVFRAASDRGDEGPPPKASYRCLSWSSAEDHRDAGGRRTREGPREQLRERRGAEDVRRHGPAGGGVPGALLAARCTLPDLLPPLAAAVAAPARAAPSAPAAAPPPPPPPRLPLLDLGP